MTNEEVKAVILATQPGATFDESGEWLNVQTEPMEWKRLAKQLRGAPLNFDYLFCLTCIDWKTHLTMVYFLSSTFHRHTIVVKSKVDRIDPVIDTVSDIWKTAELQEREVFDLFGVRFYNHPDLRRLVLTDDFSGYPLRKDYDDPVNMVKL